MFNNWLKTVVKWRPLSHHFHGAISNGHRNYASFNTKDILYETNDAAGTLLTRFAKHVAIERLNVCEAVPTTVRYADYFPITDFKYFQRQLTQTSGDQLASVIVFASSYRANADPAKFASVLNELDRYAMNKVHEMDVDTILRTLYAFLFLIPNWMTRLDFYTAALQNLFAVGNGNMSMEQFVQMSFYFGLSKKQSKNNLNKLWKTFLESNLQLFLSDLTLLDLALVSNAAFKTSTTIESNDFNERLIKEVLAITSAEGGNDALLVTFIKSLRLQRLRSKEVCVHLTRICTSRGNLQQFQPRGQVHIFAFLADNLWDNDECTQPMINEFLRHLENTNELNNVQAVRGKDLTTFLWCCAQLKCSMTKDQLFKIESCLLRMVYRKEFNYFPDQLVDSCLSLWILGFKSQELFRNAIQLKSESTSKREQPKVDSRLTVLLSAAQIEEPSWCSHREAKGFVPFNPENKVPTYLFNSEIPYKTLVSQLKEDSTFSSVQISSPINGINIPGILLKPSSATDSHIFLEFITSSQMLQFSQHPVAILRLKLQLLQSLGHKVKLLTPADFAGTLDLSDILHDECNTELSENVVKT